MPPEPTRNFYFSQSGNYVYLYITRNMTIRTSSDGTHSAFRLVEKHFKSRATAGIYPQLHEQGVLDLSRPEKVTADEVWQAGWWAPPPTDNASGRKMKRHAQSQEREKGIRPEMECGGCKRISLGDGRVGWVVAEGEAFSGTPGEYRLKWM